MLYVLILYIGAGTYWLKSTPNDRFLRNLTIMVILFSLRAFAFSISFWYLTFY